MKTTKVLSIVALSTLLGMGTLYAVDANESKPEFKQGQHCKGEKGKHGKHFGKHHKRGGHFAKIMKQLDLTDEQKKQLKALRDEKREDRKAKHEAMKKERNTVLANAITTKGFDKAQFIKDTTAKAEAKIAQKAENMEKMFAILTPEQRTKFVELLNKK
ncbi:MAG TPA: periplasmic heavy metal sensor [Campylobacterales bacterium]|nr:periplasmic heavy metal sensor [Campylobacterales bacterium]